MSAILELSDVHASYHGAISVLNGVSLQVKPGEVTALLGANGAGKSTTLKAVSGLLATEQGAVTGGSIRFLGEDATRYPAEKVVQMGLFHIMEGRRIIADMTVMENLRLGAFTRRDRQNIQRDIDRVFDFFPRLKERDGLAGYLSGGEQQMLAIGRALMAQPRILLLDEPSMGLAPILVEEIFDVITRLNERGTTI
ncbi:MAG: ABC transporter ATP-binding protein, partial [Ketobacteraceae bacterium]|nr:ABC transporter ATP-binding protein [Ketobacteraceae bacterium]